MIRDLGVLLNFRHNRPNYDSIQHNISSIAGISFFPPSPNSARLTDKATRLSECRRAVLLKPEPSTAEDGLQSVNSTQKRANVESGARAKPPVKEIITSSRDSIAFTKTMGVYLNGEATTRSRLESTVATRTQPTNGVWDVRPPLTPSIDKATVGVARERMQRGAEVGAYQYSRRLKSKGFYYPRAKPGFKEKWTSW